MKTQAVQAIVGKSDHFGRYGVKASEQEITKLRKDEIGVEGIDEDWMARLDG